MTQRQLAEISTVSVRAIRDLEGERTAGPRAQTVRLLADALRVSGARRAELEEAAGLGKSRSFDELPAPPVPLQPLISREYEVKSLTRMVRSADHRLVKVVGLPGIGKTALIQKVVDEVYRAESVPVIYLQHANVSDSVNENGSCRVLRRVADMIGSGPTMKEIAGAVGSNDALLVVDGRDVGEEDMCDLGALLRHCPGLRVIYETCDLGLHSSLAPKLPIFPLFVPEPDQYETSSLDLEGSSTIQHMISRCEELCPNSTSLAAQRAAIATLCWQLDGIPAALEAAASWLLIYSPLQLLEIAEDDRARLLESQSGPAKTLINRLRQSVASLPVDALHALRELAGAGPWTVAEAGGLLSTSPAEPRALVHELRAYGLIRRIEVKPGDPTRFRVLNLLRGLL